MLRSSRWIAGLLVVGLVGAVGFGQFGRPTPLPEPETEVVVLGKDRFILTNGVPNHRTGRFPSRGNPNRIAASPHEYQVPVEPKFAEQPTQLGLHPFGVAVNGIPFDPGAAEFYRGDRRWQYEPMKGKQLGIDLSNGHVQPTGAYHYHGLPVELVKQLGGDRDRMLLLGYAADGFPVYSSKGYVDPQDPKSGVKELKPSYRVRRGTRPGGPGGRYDGTFVADHEYVKDLGDLDECNGRFGPTPEYPDGVYHYHLTTAFPYVPRLLKGTPDASFLRQGPGGRPPGGPPGGGRPPFPPPFGRPPR